MPLLYYPMLIMLQMGADVFRAEYEYNRREDFMVLKGDDRKRRLLTDTSNACKTVLQKGSYEEITIIGKSIGTRAMCHLLTTGKRLRNASAIWLNRASYHSFLLISCSRHFF